MHWPRVQNQTFVTWSPHLCRLAVYSMIRAAYSWGYLWIVPTVCLRQVTLPVVRLGYAALLKLRVRFTCRQHAVFLLFFPFPLFQIVPSRKLQTRAFKCLRTNLFPRTPRHPPILLVDLYLHRRPEAFTAVIRSMSIWKRTRKAKPARVFGCMSLQLELVPVVRY